MHFLKKLYHPLYFILTLVLGVAIGNRIAQWRQLAQSEPYYLLTAVVIMIIAGFKDRFFETEAVRTVSKIQLITSESFEDITTWIKKNLTPYITSLDRDDVLEAAAKLVNSAMKEPVELQKQITFIGSGDLLKDPPDDSQTDDALTRYQSAISQVTSNQIHVVRYICLLEEHDFLRRGEETRNDYLRWLEKQISNAERNPNYYVYHCPRAPIWGSSRSSIITERAFVDIVGNGHSGILIRGDQIAQELKKASIDLFNNAAVKPVLQTAVMLRKTKGEFQVRLREKSGLGMMATGEKLEPTMETETR